MGRVKFGIFWTVLTLLLAGIALDQVKGWELAAILAFPVFGVGFTALAWLQMRREASLRIEQDNGVSIYVWTDFRGRECRSEKDPRSDWSDGDGDGGGDGGD